MNAHQIQNGVVVNTIVVDSLDALPDLIEATHGGIGWLWDGESFTPAPTPPAPVPQSVSPRQIRQALTAVNLRTSVEQTITSSNQDTKDWWEFATVIERAHPKVVLMGSSLGQTELQMDELFTLAGSL